LTHPLEGKSAVVTGASRGLGLAISRAYVQAGASVFICGRDSQALERAKRALLSDAAQGQAIFAEQADVSSEQDVTRLISQAIAAFGKLDILVNNAGIYGPKGLIEAIDWKEWVHAVEIDLFGAVLTCRAVLPHFRANRYGKIIQLSGGGATAPLPRISAYAASKAAIVRFVEGLAEETRDCSIDVNAIAPGALDTGMLDEVLQAGPENVGQEYYNRMLSIKQQGGAGLTRGADLAVFLASPASDGITGKLISAVWDPWEELAAHRADLAGSDVYTLRRVLPKDRGWDWGERGG